jgi:chorismate mutase
MPRREEKEKLKFLRQDILAIDEKIIELIFRRSKISEEIGKVKKKLHLPIENLAQEERVVLAGLELAESFDLDADSIELFLKSLIELSKKKQKQLLNEG